jgi:hypothetical protein
MGLGRATGDLSGCYGFELGEAAAVTIPSGGFFGRK